MSEGMGNGGPEPTEEAALDPIEAQREGRDLVPVEKKPIVANEQGFISPTDMGEALRMAEAVIRGKLAPSSYNNDPVKIMLGIMSALEAGLPPLYGLRQIAIINNRPTIWGDGAIALVQSKNLISKFETAHVGTKPTTDDLSKWPDDYGIEVKIWRRGQEGFYYGVFTVGMAKKAKLWLNASKDPWIKYPERMLFNRARAFALRDGFADALGGIAIREEVEDMIETEDKHVAVDLSDKPQVEAPPMEEAEEKENV